MKIVSREEFTLLKKLSDKFRLPTKFFLLNFRRFLKQYARSLRSRLIVKMGTIKTRKRVSIAHSKLHKLGCNKNVSKKLKPKRKRSKKYRDRQKIRKVKARLARDFVAGLVEKKVNVDDQIKEQLDLLKNRKRVSAGERSNDSESQEVIAIFEPVSTIVLDDSDEDEATEDSPVLPEVEKNDTIEKSETNTNQASVLDSHPQSKKKMSRKYRDRQNIRKLKEKLTKAFVEGLVDQKVEGCDQDETSEKPDDSDIETPDLIVINEPPVETIVLDDSEEDEGTVDNPVIPEIVKSDPPPEETETTTSDPIVKPKKASIVDSLLSKFGKTTQRNSPTKSIPSTSFSASFNENSRDSTVDSPGSANSSKTSLMEAPTFATNGKSNNEAAFISKSLDNFLKENSIEDCSETTAPTVPFRHEDGLVTEGGEIPRLEYPRQILNCNKARTVAEKRQILSQKRDVKYLMAETESQVYWELKRRSKDSTTINLDLIQNIQDQQIPFRRDIWKTASWLATEQGRFYFKTGKLANGKRVKLFGGFGNYDTKEFDLRCVDKKKVESTCNRGCRNVTAIRNLSFKDTEKFMETNSVKPPVLDSPKRISLIDSSKISTKPGPLSSKLKWDEKEDDRMMGSLEVYKMPVVQLEVSPKLGTPLPKHVKSYLKLIQPSGCITLEWAKFAASAIQVPSTTEDSFTFDIPYDNDQSKILVRRLKAEKEKKFDVDKEIKSLDVPLEAIESLDKANELEVEVGEYLSDVIDSVVIGLCENSFIKDDPDMDYSQVDGDVSTMKVTKEKVSLTTGMQNKNMKSTNIRVLKELKRLNATFIQSQSPAKKEFCDYEHCKMGCVCLDPRQSTTSPHCNREKCMFSCTCRRDAPTNRNVLIEDGLTNEEMRTLREKATERLAKAERDFSATIVLTNDNPILIHNTQVEKQKRCRKQTQIYKEFLEDCDDEAAKTHKTSVVNRIVGPKSAKIAASLPVKSPIEAMAHCSVALTKQDSFEDLEMWCMVHCLYKCFCRGQSTRGTVFGYSEKEFMTSEESSQHFPPAQTRCRNYTFDKENTTIDHEASAARTRTENIQAYWDKNKQLASSTKSAAKSKNSHLGLQALLHKRVLGCMVYLKNLVSLEESKKNKRPAESITIDKSDSDDEKDDDDTQDETYRPWNEKRRRTLSEDKRLKFIMESRIVPIKPSDDGVFKTPQDPMFNSIQGQRSDIMNLNNLVTKSMSMICEVQKSCTKDIPAPKFRQLTTITWAVLIEAFIEELVYIWEICYWEKDNKHNLIALTSTYTMPNIPGATSIINVKAVDPSSLSLLSRLINLKVVNEKTKTMAVLMFGHQQFWSILGIIRSDRNYLEENVFVKPTPQTHPRIAQKISKLHRTIYKQPESSTSKLNVSKSVPEPMKPNVSNEKPTSTAVASSSTYTVVDKSFNTKIKTNIKIRELNEIENTTIILPIPIIDGKRWFMMTVTNDFSDIYIPSWSSFLKYQKIHRSMEIAMRTGKTVRILGEKENTRNILPHVMVTAKSEDRLFIGPYGLEEEVRLVLCQELDGKMLVREKYEHQLGIERNDSTIGCWLYSKDFESQSLAPCEDEAESTLQLEAKSPPSRPTGSSRTQLIESMLANGFSHRAIGKRLNCSISIVSRIRNNMPMLQRSGRLTPYRKKRLVIAWKCGKYKSTEHVRKEFAKRENINISIENIERVLKRAGITDFTPQQSLLDKYAQDNKEDDSPGLSEEDNSNPSLESGESITFQTTEKVSETPPEIDYAAEEKTLALAVESIIELPIITDDSGDGCIVIDDDDCVEITPSDDEKNAPPIHHIVNGKKIHVVTVNNPKPVAIKSPTVVHREQSRSLLLPKRPTPELPPVPALTPIRSPAASQEKTSTLDSPVTTATLPTLQRGYKVIDSEFTTENVQILNQSTSAPPLTEKVEDSLKSTNSLLVSPPPLKRINDQVKGAKCDSPSLVISEPYSLEPSTLVDPKIIDSSAATSSSIKISAPYTLKPKRSINDPIDIVEEPKRAKLSSTMPKISAPYSLQPKAKCFKRPIPQVELQIDPKLLMLNTTPPTITSNGTSQCSTEIIRSPTSNKTIVITKITTKRSPSLQAQNNPAQQQPQPPISKIPTPTATPPPNPPEPPRVLNHEISKFIPKPSLSPTPPGLINPQTGEIEPITDDTYKTSSTAVANALKKLSNAPVSVRVKKKAEPIENVITTDIINLDLSDDEPDEDPLGDNVDENPKPKKLIKQKMKVDTVLNLETYDLRCTKTFLISEIQDLGKIPCIQDGKKVVLKLPRVKNTLRVETERLNVFLRWYIRKHVYGILPINLQIKWDVSGEELVLKNYEQLTFDTLNQNVVITQYGLIDLRDDFETENFMTLDSKLALRLLLVKIGRLINMDNPIMQPPSDLLHQIKTNISKLKVEETKLIEQKEVLKMRKLKLMKRLKGFVETESTGETEKEKVVAVAAKSDAPPTPSASSSTTTDDKSIIIIDDD